MSNNYGPCVQLLYGLPIPLVEHFYEFLAFSHADGSIKFWDASAGTLQVLYKLKTAKVFEKPKSRSLDSEEDPFAVEIISLCPESRKLCIAGASSHVILFTYQKKEVTDEITVLEVPIVYEVPDELELSPDCQFSGPGSAGSGSKLDMLDFDNKKDGPTLRVRQGPQKKAPGFQAQLVCLTSWNGGEPPSHISSLTINSSYGLDQNNAIKYLFLKYFLPRMAYGNEAGIVIIDIEQKVCLLNVGSPDLYGAQDPYSRVPRSPKKGQSDAIPINMDREERQPRSPSIDQMGRSPESPLNPQSPIPIEQAAEATEEDRSVPIPATAMKRRQSAWKGFNLKRQLSRVDIKIKNPLKDKRSNSIFYPNADNQDDEKSSPESEENTVIDNQQVTKEDQLNQKDSLDDVDQYQFPEDEDVPLQTGSMDERRVNFITRPDNLDLPDDECPVRPPRRKNKFPDKRAQRLLSVPNIKFPKGEAQVVKDLRDKDELAVSPQPTFTGNLRRRFIPNVDVNNFHFVPCFGITKARDKSSPSSSSYRAFHEEKIRQQINGMCSPMSSTTAQGGGGCPTPTAAPGGGSGVGGGGGGGGRVRPDPPRRSRSQGTRKLHKCLSTASYSEDCSASAGSHYLDKPASPAQRQQLMVARQYCSFDKLDSSFSRSRSSSMSSLENITSEAIQCLVFADSFSRKSEPLVLTPTLWVGTSLGSVLTIYITPPDPDSRVTRTFNFSNRGHGLYLASPSELQKFTLCTEFCSNLTEMMGELFLTAEMPEAPKESFLKTMFGGGVRSIDREELSNKSVAKHIPGTLGDLNSRATSASSEVSRAHKLMLERGDKLNLLEDKAEKMRTEAEQFSSSAHELMIRQRDKKWYQI
ncbi:unnamed protein product [Brassicogethes aeneus]|uniref:V-SNARE coiled-coil homology domain-containing protein n=1 Tax=Brassicogethes aeneus TaxID=1431903 RepID=A0A9P0FGS1_BRAAE|nr:unnamed protein product [Brassicogethes aeneus]